MIIDFHQHPSLGVHELMQQNDITVSVLLPDVDTNDLVLKWTRKWPGQFVPFYRVDLSDPVKAAEDLVEAVKQRGHRGIKFQPLVQRFYAHEQRLRPIFAQASELGIPVLFHSGVVAFEKHYAHYGNCVYVDELATEFPQLKIVIAHMGGNYHFEALVIAEKHENIYLDTAYLHFFCNRALPKIRPIDLIKRAIEFVGPDKVLYGCEGTRPSLILDSDIHEPHKKLILWQNAKKLLDLPEPDWQGLHV